MRSYAHRRCSSASRAAAGSPRLCARLASSATNTCVNRKVALDSACAAHRKQSYCFKRKNRSCQGKSYHLVHKELATYWARSSKGF